MSTKNSSYYKLYLELVELNKTNGWVNPTFVESDTDKEKYFRIKLEDFDSIDTGYGVLIFSVIKHGPVRYTILCLTGNN